METDYSLLVRNVYKKYNKTEYVLQGISMTVPKGQMYGLLGPSGCGKTTLLRCSLGRLDIDAGIIKLAAKKRNQIGFMPQTVSLQPELTIKESFVFYGALFAITGKALKERIDQLCNLLDLSKNKLIQNCSGGQQRRVSLAMCLLHDPELLLLDEPTVGLDAILSHRIWTYIRDLCYNQKKTVLVTTHYMEEARGLDLVGLMRGGVLLAEKPPMDLIAEFNCSSLDDVFAEVIKMKTDQKSIKEFDERIELAKNSEKSTPKLRNSKTFDWHHVSAQIYKNYIWSLRSIYVMLFVIFLPIFGAIVVGYEYRGLHVTKEVLYYNEELGSTSCSDSELIRLADCTPSLPYSCIYLNLLSQHYNLKSLTSINEGMEEIRRGHTFAVIHIPYNFTTFIIDRMSFILNEMELCIDDEKPILIWQDNTEYQIANILKWDAYMSLQRLLEMKTVECGTDIRLAQTTLTFRPEFIYGANSTFSSFVYPLVATGLAHYMSFLYTSALLLMEISSGVLERVKINGLTTSELLVANSLVHLVYDALQNILTLLTIHVVMGEESLGSISLLFIMLVLNQLQASTLATFFHTYNMTAQSVNYISTAIVVFIITTGGFIWPTEGIHWMLEPFAKYNPITMLAKSYAHVMQHGFGLTHPYVFPGIINVIVWIVLFIALTAIKVKYFVSEL